MMYRIRVMYGPSNRIATVLYEDKATAERCAAEIDALEGAWVKGGIEEIPEPKYPLSYNTWWDLDGETFLHRLIWGLVPGAVRHGKEVR